MRERRKTFAKSDMEEFEVEGLYRQLIKEFGASYTSKPEQYINLKIENGVVTGCYLGDLPSIESGYQPMDVLDQTPQYFNDKGLVKFKQRLRSIFLGSLVYNLPMGQDFVYKMLKRLTQTLPEVLKTTHYYVNNGGLSDFKSKELQYSHLILASDIQQLFSSDDLEYCSKEFTHYFEQQFSPELLGRYLDIQANGLDAFIDYLKIGRTYDEFEDELTQTVGYYNRMVYLLEEIQEQTQLKQDNKQNNKKQKRIIQL